MGTAATAAGSVGVSGAACGWHADRIKASAANASANRPILLSFISSSISPGKANLEILNYGKNGELRASFHFMALAFPPLLDLD